MQLTRIEKRVNENHNVPFTYDDEVIKLICSRCTELESGGRMIDSLLSNTVLPAISEAFLTRMLKGESIERAHINVGNDSEFGYEFD